MSEPKIPGGYIVIARQIVESQIWNKPPLYIKVWVYLLSQAQHSEYKRLKRGQLSTSIPEIIEACSWHIGYRKVKPTKDQIYQIIDWLRKPHESVHERQTKATMITTTKATQGLLITIENYNFYQDSSNYESNKESNNENDTKAISEQQQSNNINKNDNNEKNEENETKKIYTQDFLDWYSSYPNKFNKEQSFKNWNTLLKKETKENIIAATEEYKKQIKKNNTSLQYITRSTNFIGQKAEYKGYLKQVEAKPEKEHKKVQVVIKECAS